MVENEAVESGEAPLPDAGPGGKAVCDELANKAERGPEVLPDDQLTVVADAIEKATETQ